MDKVQTQTDNGGLNAVGGGGVATLKFQEQSDTGEGDYAEFPTSSAGAWKTNNAGASSAASGSAATKFVNNVYNSKTQHSTNGNGNVSNGGGRYGASSSQERDQRARVRVKYTKPPPTPKVVAPIVTDKEEDWPSLGSVPVGKKSYVVAGTNGNGNGLLNGFANNHKPTTSATNSPSSSRANSVIGQDDQERIVSAEGDNSHLGGTDHVDGELSHKLRDHCKVKSTGVVGRPKETNNNDTGNCGEEVVLVVEKKSKTRSGREKLKWLPIIMPNTSPNRPLRPNKEVTSRNGVILNGPTGRIVTSTITEVAVAPVTTTTVEENTTNASNTAPESETFTTSTVQRGRGQNRGWQGRGESHDQNNGQHSNNNYYEERRRGNSYGGRAYYGGRPRGGGGGRWHQNHYNQSRGGGASRNNRREDDDNAAGSGSHTNTNNEGYRSQDNYHAGNGGNRNDVGATNSRGGRGGDYNYYRRGQQHYNDYPSEYTELAVSYPYDVTTTGAIMTNTASDSITLPTALTITTDMDPTILVSSSSPSISHQFVMPYVEPSQMISPLLNTQDGDGGIPLGSAPMEQIVDEDRLRSMVKKQIMYYLSVQNLESDVYLRRQMNAEGYIDIEKLAGFHRLQGMTTNIGLIMEVIESCPDNFQISDDMTLVRPRLNPTVWPVFGDESPVVSGPNHNAAISSASSTLSLVASASVSAGSMKPFKLNPDVAEFVPRTNFTTSPANDDSSAADNLNSA